MGETPPGGETPGGWTSPGEDSGDRGDAVVGSPSWPSFPEQQLQEPRSGYGMHGIHTPEMGPVVGPIGGGGPPRRPVGVIVAIVAIIVIVLVLFGSLGGMALDQFGEMDPEYAEYDESVGTEPPGRVVDPELPAEVIDPPADGESAQLAIEELVQFVFTPNDEPTWEARFTDPTGLRERIEPFVGTLCAVGVSTRVVAIRYLGPDRALVEFVFLGPNIPELGRTFAFRGHVRRTADGSWVAEPDMVEHVAGLASGFCLRDENTPRQGIEDDVDDMGPHGTGTLVDPLQR